MYAFFLHNLLHFYLKDWIKSDVRPCAPQVKLLLNLRYVKSGLIYQNFQPLLKKTILKVTRPYKRNV